MNRVPRPKGYTEIRHSGGQYVYHLLQHYTNTQFTYCGIPYSIEEFSALTGISYDEIMDHIITQGQMTYQQLDDETSGKSLRVLIGMALNATLADSQRALRQYAILAKSQGDTYKPFISGEVNRAIKLTQESTAAMVNLYKSIAGNGGLTVIMNNSNGAQETNNYLTTEAALELIQKADEAKPLIIHNDKAILALEQEYHLDTMPVVNAKEQQGLNTEKEALGFKGIAKIHDGLLNELEEDHKLRHVDRRADELSVDLEADEL